MKIEMKLVRKTIEAARDESLKNVNESELMADALDKMFNYGIHHMFYVILTKLDEIERISREVSA